MKYVEIQKKLFDNVLNYMLSYVWFINSLEAFKANNLFLNLKDWCPISFCSFITKMKLWLCKLSFSRNYDE